MRPDSQVEQTVQQMHLQFMQLTHHFKRAASWKRSDLFMLIWLNASIDWPLHEVPIKHAKKSRKPRAGY